MTSITRFPLAAFIVASLALPLLPSMAAAEETGEALREAAAELRRANDGDQSLNGGGSAYAFGQSVPLFDVTPERSGSSYGALTPSFTTSASFPAETYEPIRQTAPSFGFSFRF